MIRYEFYTVTIERLKSYSYIKSTTFRHLLSYSPPRSKQLLHVGIIGTSLKALNCISLEFSVAKFMPDKYALLGLRLRGVPHKFIFGYPTKQCCSSRYIRKFIQLVICILSKIVLNQNISRALFDVS